MAAGTPINARDKYGDYLLHYACTAGHEDSIKVCRLVIILD